MNFLELIQGAPISKQKEMLIKTIDDHMQDLVQRDDITVIGIKLK